MRKSQKYSGGLSVFVYMFVVDVLCRAFVLKFPEYNDAPGTPLDDFLSYIFNTPTTLLPDKLQRAKQTLENKDMAFVILKAAHISAMAVSVEPVTGPLVESYFEVSQSRPKTKKKTHNEDGK